MHGGVAERIEDGAELVVYRRAAHDIEGRHANRNRRTRWADADAARFGIEDSMVWLARLRMPMTWPRRTTPLADPEVADGN